MSGTSHPHADSEFLLRESDLRNFVTFLLKGALDKQSRDALGKAAAKYVSMATPSLITTPLPDTDKPIVNELRANGFYVLPNVFSPEDIASIQTHLTDRELAWHSPAAKGTAKLEDVPDGAILARYDAKTVLSCPAFARCIQNRRLIRLMSEYLGAPATISINSLWWSLPTKGAPPNHQQFHHDRGDFRSCNLFVYLTDVDADSGPHGYVPATHELPLLIEWASTRFSTMEKAQRFLQWMEKHIKPDEEVAHAFGPERLLSFVGPAGTSFLEDTRGLHKGTQPRTKRRLAFEICYSVLPKYNETFEPIPRKDLGVSEEGLDDLTRYATRLMYA